MSMGWPNFYYNKSPRLLSENAGVCARVPSEI